jgi:putative membrane protein
MFVRLSAAIAAAALLSSGALAQGAKPTDPQIAHIAYTAGVIDVTAAKQALKKTRKCARSPPTWCATMRR